MTSYIYVSPYFTIFDTNGTFYVSYTNYIYNGYDIRCVFLRLPVSAPVAYVGN